MLCPNCSSSMATVRQDHSHGNDGTVYDRIMYRCGNDDWWVTIESPQEQEEE